MTDAPARPRFPAIALNRLPEPDLAGELLRAVVFLPNIEDIAEGVVPATLGGVETFEVISELQTEVGDDIQMRLATAVARVLECPDGSNPSPLLVQSTKRDMLFFGNDKLAVGCAHLETNGPLAFLINGVDGLCLITEDASDDRSWGLDVFSLSAVEEPYKTVLMEADAEIERAYHRGTAAARRRLEWVLAVGCGEVHAMAACAELKSAIVDAKSPERKFGRSTGQGLLPLGGSASFPTSSGGFRQPSDDDEAPLKRIRLQLDGRTRQFRDPVHMVKALSIAPLTDETAKRVAAAMNDGKTLDARIEETEAGPVLRIVETTAVATTAVATN